MWIIYVGDYNVIQSLLLCEIELHVLTAIKIVKVCKGASLAVGVVKDGPNEMKYKVMKCHK